MKENNKGITLLVLTITIIIILIIASTTTYYGLSAYDNARLSKFENELKIIQTQVDLWEEEGKTDIGVELSEDNKDLLGDIKDQENNILIDSANYDYYKYISAQEIRRLGIDGIENDFLVIINIPESSETLNQENIVNISNMLEYRVISVKGLKYRGYTYHTLLQLEKAGLAAGTYAIYGSVNAVASLTNKATGQVTIFDSVQGAVDAAGANPSIVTLLKDEIKLVDDANTTKNEGRVEISSEKNIILDTNGKNLISSKYQTIYNLGTLTLEGKGVIEVEGVNSENVANAIYNKGILNIYDVTIITGINNIIYENSKGINGIHNEDKGNINFYSGNLISYGITGINHNSTGTVSMTGGNIKVLNKDNKQVASDAYGIRGMTKRYNFSIRRYNIS